MGEEYPVQLAAKQREVAARLAGHVDLASWSEPVPSRESGFRNKAKLVVGGCRGAPTTGILDRQGRGVDLRHCGLYEPGLADVVRAVPGLVAEAGLTPYDVPSRQGELKHVLLTHSPDGELMARLVLRSPGQRRRVEELLAALAERHDLPTVRVASLNLQPDHAAVLEGPDEEVLTPHRTLAMRVGEVRLHLGTRSFFQTNTAVAAELYAQVRDWAAQIAPATVWDLYCGVGGFAVHLARPGREVTGVELSAEAVRSAARTRGELPAALAHGLTLVTEDATAFALASAPADRPDLVVVNPPRRGIGTLLARWLDGSGIPHVAYSSCSVESLARDLDRMPSYRVSRARVFDMFPQTRHHEVAVLLQHV